MQSSESLYIVGESPYDRTVLTDALHYLLPRVEVKWLKAVPESAEGSTLILSFLDDVDKFLGLQRVAEMTDVAMIQVRFQSFLVGDDAADDIWEAPLLNEEAKVTLLDLPFLSASIFHEVERELERAGEHELDDSSFFNIVQTQDASRVIASVVAQTLSGANNWGRYTYATGGKVTWHRLVAFLGESLDDDRVADLVAGSGLGLERTLDGESLKHAFGIQPRPWRTGLVDAWREYNA